MRRKELVKKFSEEFNVKPGQSGKMVDFVLRQLVESGLSDDGFYSPIMKLRSRSFPSQVLKTEEGEKVVPARKVTKMIPAKEYESRAFVSSN